MLVIKSKPRPINTRSYSICGEDGGLVVFEARHHFFPLKECTIRWYVDHIGSQHFGCGAVLHIVGDDAAMVHHHAECKETKDYLDSI